MRTIDVKYSISSGVILLVMLTSAARAWGRSHIKRCISYKPGVVYPTMPELEADYYLLERESGAPVWFAAFTSRLVLAQAEPERKWFARRERARVLQTA